MLNAADSSHIPSRRMVVQPMPDGTDLVLYSFEYNDWQHIKTEALQAYKRQRIKTWTDNLDLMPEDMRKDAIRDAYRRMEDITHDDLPTKLIKIPETVQNGDGKPLLDEDGLVVLAKDQDGNLVMRDIAADYVSWWVSETEDGKLFALWLSARHAPGQETITRGDIANRIMGKAGVLEEAAQHVGRMSQSELAKNSSGPGTTGANLEDHRQQVATQPIVQRTGL